MSCTSSPSRSSLGEQTIFTFRDPFVLPSDATAGRTSAADASHYGYTFPSGNGSPNYSLAVNIGAAPDLPVDNAIVEGIADGPDERSSETYSYAPYQSDDKDWHLFNNSNEALPILDNSDFYIDADACVDSPPASYESTTNIEVEVEDISLDDFPSYDYTDREHVNEAINDFELDSQNGYMPAEFSESIQQETLLQHWQYDYQRHERVALKFHQPLYTQSYSVPYATARL